MTGDLVESLVMVDCDQRSFILIMNLSFYLWCTGLGTLGMVEGGGGGAACIHNFDEE